MMLIFGPPYFHSAADSEDFQGPYFGPVLAAVFGWIWTIFAVRNWCYCPEPRIQCVSSELSLCMSTLWPLCFLLTLRVTYPSPSVCRGALPSSSTYASQNEGVVPPEISLPMYLNPILASEFPTEGTQTKTLGYWFAFPGRILIHLIRTKSCLESHTFGPSLKTLPLLYRLPLSLYSSSWTIQPSSPHKEPNLQTWTLSAESCSNMNRLLFNSTSQWPDCTHSGRRYSWNLLQFFIHWFVMLDSL